MSTQQALGVIGGVVGSFFGYPQLGFVVGSLVGGLLTPKEKIEGPRVEDLKVQVSTYGAGIPVVYGNARVGGNVIWSTDKIETETTEDVGKGGGAENTTYRYFVHMGISLCETPRDGSLVTVAQIFQDGKLIYDARTGIPLLSAIASAENPHAFAILYQGDEAQLPDPIEEVFLGIGNVPAYRGIVRIRMNAVECPGGRVPQFSFVLARGAELVDDLNLGETVSIPTPDKLSASRLTPDGTTSYFFSETAYPSPPNYPRKQVAVYALNMQGVTKINQYVLGTEFWGAYTALQGDADIDAICFRQVSSVDIADSGINVVYDKEGNQLKAFYLGPDCLAFGQTTSSWAKAGNWFAIAGDGSQVDDTVCLFDWESAVEVSRVEIPANYRLHLTSSHLYVLIGGTSTTIQARSLNSSLSLVDTAALPSEIDGYTVEFSSNGTTLSMYAYEFTGVNARTYTVSVSGGDIVFTLRNIATRIDGSLPSPIEPTVRVQTNTAYGWERLEVAEETELRLFMLAFDRVEMRDAQVSFVLADQCMRAGLLPEQFDVTGIDGDIHGYTLANPASARSNIQPLMTAFAIDATEEDGKLKFFKRSSKSSVATILYEELGAVESDSEAGDPMPLTRAQDAELPRSVSASYTNKDFDYQTGTEKAIRQIFDSQNDMMVDLAMSTTSDHAATVAQAILYDSHNDRNKRSLKVSRKYAFLSAGDVVTVEYPATILADWRIAQITDTGALIEIECVPFDAAIYTQTAVGATGYNGQQVSPLPPPTQLIIGDWPLLRDADNNPGIYTAFAPLGPGGRGATLYTGLDDSSLQERGSVFSYVAIGLASDVLGTWDINIIDQTNTLTISASAGSFSSVSYESLMGDRRVNACAVGAPGRWEMLQFMTAVDLGNGELMLRDFIRGLRGTEHNTGNHEVGDRVVMLTPAGMLRPNMDVGSLNQEMRYRAVTLGRSLQSASSQSYANTGEGLRPFSPVNLVHEFDGTDVLFAWNRRTRLSNNWLSGVVPLGESTEAYRLTLYTDGTFADVQRVILTSTPSATYTAAQMSADGYTPGDPLYVRVQQISDLVGAGHALEETL